METRRPKARGGRLQPGAQPRGRAAPPPKKTPPAEVGGGTRRHEGGGDVPPPPEVISCTKGRAGGTAAAPRPETNRTHVWGCWGPPAGAEGCQPPPAGRPQRGGGPVPPPSEKKGSGKQQLLTPPSPLRGTRRGKGPENRFGEGARDGEGRRGWADGPPPRQHIPSTVWQRGPPETPPPFCAGRGAPTVSVAASERGDGEGERGEVGVGKGGAKNPRPPPPPHPELPPPPRPAGR